MDVKYCKESSVPNNILPRGKKLIIRVVDGEDSVSSQHPSENLLMEGESTRE